MEADGPISLYPCIICLIYVDSWKIDTLHVHTIWLENLDRNTPSGIAKISASTKNK